MGQPPDEHGLGPDDSTHAKLDLEALAKELEVKGPLCRQRASGPQADPHRAQAWPPCADRPPSSPLPPARSLPYRRPQPLTAPRRYSTCQLARSRDWALPKFPCVLDTTNGEGAGKMSTRQNERVVIVIVNWNRANETIGCCSSLERLEYPNYKIVVVDNGSDDDSIRVLRASLPDIHILEMGYNAGFAAGSNAGIRYALQHNAELVWLLNNDTVVEPTALSALVDVSHEGRNLGAIGSVVCSMDDRNKVLCWGGGRWNWVTGRSRDMRTAGRLRYISGVSMVVSRVAFETVGLFNEKYFMYWEDCEFSLLLKRRGFNLAVAQKSRVLHYESRSAGKGSIRKDYLHSTSATMFFRDNAPVAWLPIVVATSGRLVSRLLRRRWKHAKAILQGVIDGWKH